MKPMKYIGLDVHPATISVAVLDDRGKLIMECILETKAATILEFLEGLRGSLSVTFEEGTWAAWLHDLLKPHVANLVVCDPRKNALLKDGSKSDRIDARKRAELLRGNQLSPVYHGEHGLRTLKELARSYLTIRQDLVRVMVWVNAIPCSGKQVYAVRHGAAWRDKIGEAGVRRRAEFYYQPLDALRSLRQEVRRDLVLESARHPATKRLRQVPSIGPIRAALLIALLQTPHRFRSKRQLWAYSGFGIETHDRGEHRYLDGELRRFEEESIGSWAQSKLQSRS
jgi:transposase